MMESIVNLINRLSTVLRIIDRLLTFLARRSLLAIVTHPVNAFCTPQTDRQTDRQTMQSLQLLACYYSTFSTSTYVQLGSIFVTWNLSLNVV